ncbi:MAG: hypothetical protein AB7R90_10420 [Reyranellaceae bacterium]
MKKLVPLVLLLLPVACAPFAPSPPEKGVYTVQTAFNPADFAWSMNQGTASVEGRAMLKGSDGRVRTCAGELVALTADNAYTREASAAAKTRQYSRIERDPRYARYRRTTTCDTNGRFLFRHLPHGRWGVGTRVEWEEAGSQGKVVRGGPMGKTFTLKAGEKATIAMGEGDL